MLEDAAQMALLSVTPVGPPVATRWRHPKGGHTSEATREGASAELTKLLGLRRKLFGAAEKALREAVRGSEGCEKARRARWTALAWSSGGPFGSTRLSAHHSRASRRPRRTGSRARRWAQA
eukprot:3579136-Prymnesium_polylepis.2